ncbi:MAG TPA: alpha/beta hydrolase-fold protein [Anaerolineales bacterium]|nr:alpha/beta hydrolase-fold protein [Anaerolineales bacterium]
MRLLFFIALVVLAIALVACQSAGAAPDSSAQVVQATGAMPTEIIETRPPDATPVRTGPVAPSPTSTEGATPSPAPSPSPDAPSCLASGGRIDSHELTNDLSLLSWEFRVYTPPCYQEEGGRRYPLLILIHGQTYTDDQWDRLGVDETADRLISRGEIPALIILMPRDRRWVDPPKDRFGEALIGHVLPWVDENYRTLPERHFRAIGGLSRGASWAVHLGLSHWELFGSIGAHSLPVFWSDTPKARRMLEAVPAGSMPKIYLDIGEGDYLIESAVWFESLLNELDIPHSWHLFAGKHEEAYWMRHIEEYLRWYTADWAQVE